jgi:toxin YoeB
MEIVLLPKAEEHLAYWKKTGNKAILKRIAMLTKAIIETPFEGIGKPEPLKHQLAGKWSRRIDYENRYIYTVDKQTLFIYALKGHYM